MNFIILPTNTRAPKSGVNTAYMEIDRWNDYSFVTMFYVSLHDEEGDYLKIGNVKIGFKGQTTQEATHELLDGHFQQLPDGYFSVGQDVDYYQKIAELSDDTKTQLLADIKDIAFNHELIDLAQGEEVFRTSLLRSVSLSAIKGQFSKVLNNLAPLTDFEFEFRRPEEEKMSGIELDFKVTPESKPSTNIHAIIGRNGVGKTTILNNMIEAIVRKDRSSASFYDTSDDNFLDYSPDSIIANDYFSNLVSVSFSAFDPFEPPEERSDPSQGTCYFYIGLKGKDSNAKKPADLRKEFTEALGVCLSQHLKKKRWLNAVKRLESDENFASMNLPDLAESSNTDDAKAKAKKVIGRMSSGHASVILTITRLVATTEEKTLVLIDEPESHLHPPLLSAFIRSLSELLYDRNGVSIIATHSPVVLQEVPKSCVWKINRSGLETKPYRPDIETFGENVGILTRDVFGLEVVKSGFHDLLVKSVESGKTYEEIVIEYNDQLGMEARALLKALILNANGGKD